MQQLQKEVCECQNEMSSSPSSAGSAPSGTFTFFPGSSTTNRHRTVISTKILFHELQRWNLYESSLPKSVRLLAQNYNKSVDSPEILQSLPKILLIFFVKKTKILSCRQAPYTRPSVEIFFEKQGDYRYETQECCCCCCCSGSGCRHDRLRRFCFFHRCFFYL